MGGGTWTTSSFRSYSASRGRSVDSSGTVTTLYSSAQDMYTERSLSKSMDPLSFDVRECHDSEEHPSTVPVILALDVTGSMGGTAIKVAKELNKIVGGISQKDKDAEFCVMAIGDTYCDRAPVQMSQFESDVRIAEAFDKIYFEGGGGSNAWESYTAAWYMAAYRTDLDVWKRGGKGILITLGDEPINPYLDTSELIDFVGRKNMSSVFAKGIGTKELYDVVKQKYDVYHIFVDHHGDGYDGVKEKAIKSFREVLPDQHVVCCKVDDLSDAITDIVLRAPHESVSEPATSTKVDENGCIDW